MSQRIVHLPGIEPIQLPIARQSTVALHAYLRERILDGRLPPGTTLSQSALAGQLGVSRTPVREVLRMLQEEGFVEFEPNQRMRVAGLDPAALDSDYAARIMLGTLALSMTAEQIGAAEIRKAEALLRTMRTAARRKDFDTWLAAHDDFHSSFEVAAPEPMRRQLKALADRSKRYIQMRQATLPATWANIGDAEHPAILAAIVDGDCQAAVSALAHHLAGTALRVFAHAAPDYTPRAVPRAVEIVTGTKPDVQVYAL